MFLLLSGWWWWGGVGGSCGVLAMWRKKQKQKRQKNTAEKVASSLHGLLKEIQHYGRTSGRRPVFIEVGNQNAETGKSRSPSNVEISGKLEQERNTSGVLVRRFYGGS